MVRKRDGLVSIRDALSDLDGPVKATRTASPQAVHHFTLSDQVNQLVEASEADPDMGFMARLMALCSLPRTNPGNRLQYKRVNGPYKLAMIAGTDNKLPYGNLPRLLLAWVCTEAVRTQSRVLILGDSVSEFMRKLDIYSTSGEKYTRLRNQMDRLFHASVQLIYEDEGSKASVSSFVADRTEFWWDPKHPDERSLWKSKIRLGEDFFNEIISHPVPLDMNILKCQSPRYIPHPVTKVIPPFWETSSSRLSLVLLVLVGKTFPNQFPPWKFESPSGPSTSVVLAAGLATD